MEVRNLFSRSKDPKHHKLAARLLSGRPASFDDLCTVAGLGHQISPTTVHLVVMMVEDQGGLVVRFRDPMYGTVYRYLPGEVAEPGDRLTATESVWTDRDIVRRWRSKIG